MDGVRKFSVRTVLTLTTGHLLTDSKGKSDNGFGDMYDLIGHMLGDTPSTYGLGRAADICRPHIFHWYPELDSDELRLEVEKLSSILTGFSKNIEADVINAVIVGWFNSLVARDICLEEYGIGYIGKHVKTKIH